jgi:hypothetical protein
MAKSNPKKATGGERKLVSSKEGKQYIYCNHFGIAQSPFDVRLTFAEITDVTNDTVEVRERVQVTMSLPFAKIVSEMLSDRVKAIEEAHGPIANIADEGKKKD